MSRTQVAGRLLGGFGSAGVGTGFSNGLVVSAVANATVNITANLLSMPTASLSAVSVSTAITTSGANGLDTGAEAANTWYAIFVIANADGTTVGALLSTSLTPTLPGGYTQYRRVGWVRNNASSNFLHFYQESGRVTFNDPVLNLTSLSVGAFTVSFATMIPPTSRFGHFSLNAQSANGVDTSASIALRVSSAYSFINMVSIRGSAGNNLTTTAETIHQVTSGQQMDVSYGGLSPIAGMIWVIGYLENA